MKCNNFKDFEIFYSTSSNDKGFHTLVFSIIKNVLTKKSKNDINEFPITSEYDIFLKKYITDEVLCNKIIKTQYIIKLDTLKYKIDILKNLSNFYKYNIIYLEFDYLGDLNYFPFIPEQKVENFINKSGDKNKMTIPNNYFYKKESIIIYNHIYQSYDDKDEDIFTLPLYNKDDTVVYSSIIKLVKECNFINDFVKYYVSNEDFQTK